MFEVEGRDDDADADAVGAAADGRVGAALEKGGALKRRLSLEDCDESDGVWECCAGGRDG